MPFAKMDHLGYLTFCPSNLGTTMRASVHMKIPNTAALPHFKDICDQLQIQARGKMTQKENNICIRIAMVRVTHCIFQNTQWKKFVYNLCKTHPKSSILIGGSIIITPRNMEVWNYKLPVLL